MEVELKLKVAVCAFISTMAGNRGINSLLIHCVFELSSFLVKTFPLFQFRTGKESPVGKWLIGPNFRPDFVCKHGFNPPVGSHLLCSFEFSIFPGKEGAERYCDVMMDAGVRHSAKALCHGFFRTGQR